MKKILTIIALSSLASAALADNSFDDKFYVGAELNQNYSSLSDTAKNYNQRYDKKVVKNSSLGGTLFFGKTWQDWGAEFGYSNIQNSKYDVVGQNRSIKARSYNLYLDGNYYYPINDSIKLIGSAGLGRLSASGSDANNSINESKIGYRLGLGAQMKIVDNIAARTMVRYQKGNSFIKGVTSLGLGCAWYF